MTTDPSLDPTYRYRSSLMGAGWEYRLGSDALHWQAGPRSGSVPYEAIRRVRLSFRPQTTQFHRFLTEIWADGVPKLSIASTSVKGIAEQESQDAAYSDFVAQLHQRLDAARTEIVFKTGSHPAIYWMGVSLFAVVALGLAALTVRALQIASWSGAAFTAGFLLLFLWRIGQFFRRNRPRRYRASDLPAELLPR